MSKLASKAKDSKLSNVVSKEKQPKPRLVNKSKAAPTPTSVRLTGDDKVILSNLVKGINHLSNSRLSESDTIRALIRYCENAEINDIFQSYKDGL